MEHILEKKTRVLLIAIEPVTPYVYGVRSISAMLKSHGFHTSILFLHPNQFATEDGATTDHFLDFCSGYDVLGMSFMSPRFFMATTLTTRIRQRWPEKIVVFGGHDSIVDPVRNLKVADAVCTGEGETAFLDYLRQREAGDHQRAVPGMVLRHGHDTLQAPLPALMRNFDEVPTVDNDFATHFVTHNNQIFPMVGSMAKRHLGHDYMTMTSFGCTMRCTYCVNNKMMELYPDWKKVRRRPVAHIMREFQDALTHIPLILSVNLVDDDFGSAPIAYLEEFRDHYKREVNLPLDVMGLRPVDVTREKLDLLQDMGTVKVRMGIQSVAPSVKKLFRRNFTNDYIMEKVNLLHQYRNCFWAIRYDFIVDTPWDPPEASLETLQFMARMPPPFFPNVFTLAHYPGTELYNRALAEGIVNESDVWEGRLNENFMELKPTWLNFLMIGMGIIHISPKVLALLTHPRLTQRINRVPSAMMTLAQLLAFLKRFLVFLSKGDRAQLKKLSLYLREYAFLFFKPKSRVAPPPTLTNHDKSPA
ncbi:MAG: B12-binding domain-containing radical SAM protein [Nitrospirae bacterium]|nr:B12-binding domain-containing radical SAM protein [Magnetococcales bacterium]